MRSKVTIEPDEVLGTRVSRISWFGSLRLCEDRTQTPNEESPVRSFLLSRVSGWTRSKYVRKIPLPFSPLTPNTI